MFKFSDLWGMIGAMLLLILVYLILEHGTSANMLVSSTASAGTNIFKTLQGR